MKDGKKIMEQIRSHGSGKVKTFASQFTEKTNLTAAPNSKSPLRLHSS
jgi:hypothetical protein